MSLIDEVYSNIKERKHNVEIGKINGIPFAIPEMRKYIPSIERSNYYLITGPSKGAKSQLTNDLILYNSIFYAHDHPDLLTVHFIMFPLEEGKEMTMCRFMSHVLYEWYNTRISPSDLMSSNPEKPLSNDILSILESEKFREIISFFESCIQFEEANTSVGIDIIVKNYAKTHGETIYGDETFVDENGIERHKIIGYKPNDPNEYVFVLIDHANLIVPTKDEKTDFNAIAETSKNLVKYYRNYHYISVLVQQQADGEVTSLEAAKNLNILPTKAGLRSQKSSGNDCTCMLGICNPGFIQTLNEFKGYDLRRFKRKYLRFCNIIFQRFGEAEVEVPLFFDGAVNHFQKFPRPEDVDGLKKIDDVIAEIEKGSTKRFMFSMLIKKLFKKNRRNE